MRSIIDNVDIIMESKISKYEYVFIAINRVNGLSYLHINTYRYQSFCRVFFWYNFNPEGGSLYIDWG